MDGDWLMTENLVLAKAMLNEWNARLPERIRLGWAETGAAQQHFYLERAERLAEQLRRLGYEVVQIARQVAA